MNVYEIDLVIKLSKIANIQYQVKDIKIFKN